LTEAEKRASVRLVTPRTVDLARQATRRSDPEEALSAVTALRRNLDSLEAQHVENAVRAGLSWSRIAELLGISKQAVHKKYAARVRAKLARPTQTSSGGRPTPSEAALQAIRFARQEAGSMQHQWVGPEHLLLGLLRDDRGPASETLEGIGVSFAAVRREVRRLYGEQDSGENAEEAPESAEWPISSRARATLALSLRVAADRGDEELGVEHILLALLRDRDGGAVRALAALGVTTKQVERELDSHLERVEAGERPIPKEEAVAEEERRRGLSQDELDAEIGAALPERELMSILPMPDASGAELTAILDDLDPEPGEEPEQDPPRRPPGSRQD
jgi:Clp amino terminal domain, pathogenicity island component